MPCVTAKALGEKADTMDLGYALVEGVMVPHASKFKSVIDHIQKKQSPDPKKAGLGNSFPNDNNIKDFSKVKSPNCMGIPQWP